MKHERFELTVDVVVPDETDADGLGKVRRELIARMHVPPLQSETLKSVQITKIVFVPKGQADGVEV